MNRHFVFLRMVEKTTKNNIFLLVREKEDLIESVFFVRKINYYTTTNYALLIVCF